MLDVGFWELLLVSVIALIFIGPEKLPGTIRTVALMVGRFRRSLANLRMEFENEIGADEIRQQLHNEAIMDSLKETKSELDNAIAETERTIRDVTHPLAAAAPMDSAGPAVSSAVTDTLSTPDSSQPGQTGTQPNP